MNYIKLINRFWEIQRESKDIDAYAIALYFAIVGMSNSNKWQPVSLYRDDVLALARISKTTYYKVRTILKNAGLIDFKDGANGLTKCTFTVLISNVQCPINGTVDETVEVKNEGSVSHALSQKEDAQCPINETIHINTNKHINSLPKEEGKNKNQDSQNKIEDSEPAKIISLPTEENEEEKEKKSSGQKKEKGFEDVIFPFDSPNFNEMWNIWIEYRKQRKEKPYVPIGLQAVLTRLAKDSNGDESEAIEIIKFSMSKNWTGLYPERNKQTHSPNQQKSNGKPKYSFDELRAEVERTAGPTSFSKQGT